MTAYMSLSFERQQELYIDGHLNAAGSFCYMHIVHGHLLQVYSVRDAQTKLLDYSSFLWILKNKGWELAQADHRTTTVCTS